MSNILIVDDEKDICEILKFNLEQQNYQVDLAHSAEAALEKNLTKYDLMLFDVMMDGLSGYELLQVVRTRHQLQTPVVFITALTSEDNVLEGFTHGADDYIRKPFSTKEVIVRIKTILDRAKRQPWHSPNSMNNISIDSAQKAIIINNKTIELTRTEYDIFLLLYQHPGKVYSRDEILEHIWTSQQYVLGRTVDVNITRIRRKMGELGKHIVTRSGYGYYFDNKPITQ